jgi:hypothetical protein
MPDFPYRTASRWFSFSFPNIRSISPRFVYFSMSYSLSFGFFFPVLPAGYYFSPVPAETRRCHTPSPQSPRIRLYLRSGSHTGMRLRPSRIRPRERLF